MRITLGKRFRYHLFSIKQSLLLLKTDVVIASYPKTGGTWLQLMIKTLLLKHFNLEDSTNIFVNQFSDMLRADPFPKIYLTHAMPWFNEETCPRLSMELGKFKRQKIILLAREPKDTLVSLYFHNCYRTAPPVYTNDINAMVTDKIYGIWKYIKYYQTWHQHEKLFKDLLLLKYEDLHSQPQQSLRKLTDFIGLYDIKDETITEAIRFCKFDNMKKLESDDVNIVPGLNRSKNPTPEAFKVREGIVGGYKKYLNEKTIKYIDETIIKQLSDIYGYPQTQ